MNFDERIDKKTKKNVLPAYIIIHYTSGCTSKKAFQSLSNYFRRVSSHYVISEDGTISQLVDESKRAWHAGVSSWKEHSDINTHSIGIEIVNPGFSKINQAPCIQNSNLWNTAQGVIIPGSEFMWYRFTEAQINSTISLCKEIIQKYNIKPKHILGHSDIAPERKIDPGPLFPWKALAENKVGIWHPQAQSASYKEPSVLETQEALKRWGYNIHISGKLDNQTKKVVQAFQMHFRPEKIDGIMDVETYSILKTLEAHHST